MVRRRDWQGRGKNPATLQGGAGGNAGAENGSCAGWGRMVGLRSGGAEGSPGRPMVILVEENSLEIENGKGDQEGH